MRKAIGLVAAMLAAAVAGVTGEAQATLYTQAADNFVGSYYVAGGQTYSFGFSTPAGFSVPPDTLGFATLVLTGTPDARMGGSDVTVGGVDYSSLGSSYMSTAGNVNTYRIDLASQLSGGNVGTGALPLELSVASHGHDDGFTLLSALLSLDYTDGSGSSDPDNAPVAEPATLLLFGIGLAGLGSWGRKRRAAAQP